MEITRIKPQEARQRVESGQALFVCGYEDEEKFKAFRLDGAISFNEFKSRLPSVAKHQEIIFYCA